MESRVSTARTSLVASTERCVILSVSQGLQPWCSLCVYMHVGGGGGVTIHRTAPLQLPLLKRANKEGIATTAGYGIMILGAEF